MTLEEIPNLNSKKSELVDEALEFLAMDAEEAPAWELRVYTSKASASSSSAHLNKVFRERNIPLTSLARGFAIILVRASDAPVSANARAAQASATPPAERKTGKKKTKRVS
jgi:hypothetical protein